MGSIINEGCLDQTHSEDLAFFKKICFVEKRSRGSWDLAFLMGGERPIFRRIIGLWGGIEFWGGNDHRRKIKIIVHLWRKPYVRKKRSS